MKAMIFHKAFAHYCQKLGLFFAKPDILFYTLPWLMFLVIIGTISQKYIGLYAATEAYFGSVILWLGPIPTPGGITTLGIIFIALTVKFIFYSPWNRKKAGTIITHFGILLLLLGGIITSISSKEGFMLIEEGRNSASIASYYDKVLVFKTEKTRLQTNDFGSLKKGDRLNISDLDIQILEQCENCGARAPSGLYDNLQGLAENMELHPIALEMEKERNFAGLILDIKDKKNNDVSGTYIVMEDIPKNPIFKTSDGTLEILLERQKRPLPFSLTLKDFRKISYPGTDKAKEYESDLIIHDGDVFWPVTISMNKPLRYKGYTFYQSSFEQRPDIEVTILSVVENKGRAFPYIATLIIFAGLLTHLILHLQSGRKDKMTNKKGGKKHV